MSLKFTLLSFYLVVASMAFSQADTIIMKDGEKYIGKISTDTKDFIQLIIGQSSHILQKKEIDRIISGKTGAISFSEVISVEGVSKDELFKKARMWYVDIFRDAKSVIQIIEKEDGEIVGKGSFRYISSIFVGSNSSSGEIRFSVKILVKENRYKYVITDFIHEGNSIDFGLITEDINCPYEELDANKKWKEKVWKDIKDVANKNALQLILSLKESMANPIIIDEW